jgi:hypothetical protein
MTAAAETQPKGERIGTITVEGRPYQVYRDYDNGGGVDGKPAGPTYWLAGPRGALYFTIRNVPHPDRMFLVNGHGFTRSAPQTWLRDRDGQLVTDRGAELVTS